MTTLKDRNNAWLPEPLDECQMRSIIGLLDTYEADPHGARVMLDQLYRDGALSGRHRQAVRILFLLPTADADELLARACKDEQARRVFLSMRGQ